MSELDAEEYQKFKSDKEKKEEKQRTIKEMKSNPIIYLGYLFFVAGMVIAIINITDWITLILIVIGYIIMIAGGYKIAVVRR